MISEIIINPSNNLTCSLIFVEPSHRLFLQTEGFQLTQGVDQLSPKTKSPLLHQLIVCQQPEMLKILLNKNLDVNQVRRSMHLFTPHSVATGGFCGLC